MLKSNRVARRSSVAQLLAVGYALAGCMLLPARSLAQPPQTQLPLAERSVEPSQQDAVDQAIGQLIAQLRQPSASSRAAAATKLARLGPQAALATEPLIRCLNDTDSDVRLAAAYALGCVQQEPVGTLAALVPLLTDQDEHVRYSAEWSIARISKNLDGRPDAAQRRDLIAVLETALQHLLTHEHQARHRVAMELAVSRLRQAAQDELRAAAPPENPREPLVQTQTETPTPVVTAANAGLELAGRVYAASDLLGRLQFVERLSDFETYSDDMRRVVIRFEHLQGETAILRYAVTRWGSRGQRLIAEQFDELASGSALVAADAAVIELLEPRAPEQWERLLELAGRRPQAIEVRLAALSAISAATANPVAPHCVERLLDLLADASEAVEVRTAAAETLAGMGSSAARAEARLVKLLRDEQDAQVRHGIAHALARTAMTSSAAARAMREALLATPTDSEHYCDMVACCGQFGRLSEGCLPQLIAGLSHSDERVRLNCATSLEHIGPSAREAGPELVARILDTEERVSVKNAAASALAAMGSEGLKPLIVHLAHREHAAHAHSPDHHLVCEHALRALAVAGPRAEAACDECLTILNDSKSSPAVRSAAAMALGAMGSASARAVPKLLELSASDQPDALRSASLMAAVQIEPHACRAQIERLSHEPGTMLRASAACAYRLAGQPKRGFDMLVGMLDGSDTDEVIEQALAEFGSAAEPWLVQVAGATDAPPEQRLVCFRLACAAPAPAWAELLPLMDDDNLGDAMALSIGGQVSEDTRAVSMLLTHLRDHDLTPSAHARLVRLLTPDGLGAAGDEENWQGGLALNQPTAVELLASADSRSVGADESPAGDTAPTAEASPALETGLPDLSLPGGAAPPNASSAPLGATQPSGGSRSGGAGHSDTRPVPQSRPDEPIEPGIIARATGPAPASTASMDLPQLAEVFYGTNRARLAGDGPPRELAARVLATVGGALLAMLVCLIGFLRSGHRPFAIVALIAIGAVAPFGFQAAQSYSRQTLTPTLAYGGEYRAEIELGVCEVSIPPGHQPGALESPNLFKLEIKPDVEKHVVLTSVEQLTKDRFFDQLHSRMDADGKNILVFIHGYNVSFEDAARRTAQMAADLKFPGAPVFYSWPSQANWYGYTTDKENIELSVTQIKSFLLELAAKSGATTINLVAHSMGNVGLTQALKEMEGLSPQPMFNQVVLAAPDIDADIFKNRVAPYIVTKARHVTLYTSQTDLALIASRYFNSGPRVGDSAAGVLLFPGIDTIDATAVDSSLLGHSYYGSNVSVLTDLGYVLQNQPVASRQYLRTIIDATQPYWAFDPLRISRSSAPAAQR